MDAGGHSQSSLTFDLISLLATWIIASFVLPVVDLLVAFGSALGLGKGLAAS